MTTPDELLEQENPYINFITLPKGFRPIGPADEVVVSVPVLMKWRDSQVKEALYGFHEYIIGKNIIQSETDQAFNYARLHRALDDYTTKQRQRLSELERKRK